MFPFSVIRDFPRRAQHNASATTITVPALRVAGQGSILTRELDSNIVGKIVKILLYGILAIVATMAIVVGVAGVFSWSPTMGRSMEPTLPAIGGWIHTLPQTPDRIRPGRIIRFNAPNGGICVKRIEKVNADQTKVWVSADNKGWTGEDSDQYGWVRTSQIIGVATEVWSPKRLWRSASRRGQFQNWLEMNFPPQARRESLPGLETWHGELAEYFWDSSGTPQKGITITAKGGSISIDPKTQTLRYEGNPRGFHIVILEKDGECKILNRSDARSPRGILASR